MNFAATQRLATPVDAILPDNCIYNQSMTLDAPVLPAASANPPSLDQIPGIWRGRSAPRIETMPTGHRDLDQLLPAGGLPVGAITEVLHARPGVGELTVVLPMLARLTQAGSRVALVAPPHVPFAPGLAQAGLALPRTVVIQPPSAGECLWGIEQMLRAGVFGCVVGWVSEIEVHALRRFQLAAETGRSIGVLMRPLQAQVQASPAAVRLKLTRIDRRLDVEVLKARGGSSGQHWKAA